ncbi:hypothetical protein Tsubulata_005121 [Turnera subulata]|uniref:RBR-type E3 ubiquitin transferase n=1 Tax=Turnera subulata TaxID=218843 RepID=A0A9Q0FS86_9ROSI|nr:hypothetical protein Tsubulata_005121 [Turnera subulata]
MKRRRPTKRTATKMQNLGKTGIIPIINLDEADDSSGGGGGDGDSGFLYKKPTLLRGSTKQDAICVEQYSEERDFDRVTVKASVKQEKNFIIDLSLDFTLVDEDIRMFSFKPENTLFGRRCSSQKPILIIDDPVLGQGEPSNSRDEQFFVCEICTETRDDAEWFSIKGCPHAYCTHCVVQYVSSKVEENLTDIRCPASDCTMGALDPEHCRAVLPREVFDRWGNALCEAVILEAQKFYCPFKDCSAMLINDGGEVVRESECPNCSRMFCAQCKVAWHSGIECEEFQKLHKDEREREDILLMKLAGDHQWRRCPNCRAYVERTMGCNFIKCR